MKAFLYFLFCLSFCTELIQCSCLSYGHSCWGAHGKRASITTSHKVEVGTPPEQWNLIKLDPEELNNIYRREHNIRISQDDSMDVIGEDGEKSDLKTNENKVPKLFSGFGIKRLLHKPLNSDNSRQGQDKQQLYDTENESYNNPNEPREFLILRNLKFYKQLVNNGRKRRLDQNLNH